jgi:hypothetical protein
LAGNKTDVLAFLNLPINKSATMTLYEFNAADELEQLQAVWKGVSLGSKKDEVYDINLYQIDSFYVEEYIHRKNDVRHKFRSFSNPDLLESYTSQIDISEI